MRRPYIFFVAFLLLLYAGDLQAQDLPPEKIAAILKDVAGSDHYETGLAMPDPGPTETTHASMPPQNSFVPEAAPPPPPSTDSIKRPGDNKHYDRKPGTGNPIETAGYLLLSTAILTGVALGVLSLLKMLSKDSHLNTGNGQGGTPVGFGPRAKMERVLAQAQELAAAEKLMEAIHLFLRDLIEEIRFNFDPEIRENYTTREVIRRTTLKEGIGELKVIAGHVERTFFGGRECTLPIVNECITAFRSFYTICYGWSE